MDPVRETSCDSELDVDAHGREQNPPVPDAPDDAESMPHTPTHKTPEVSLSVALSYIDAKWLDKARSNSAGPLHNTARNLHASPAAACEQLLRSYEVQEVATAITRGCMGRVIIMPEPELYRRAALCISDADGNRT